MTKETLIIIGLILIVMGAWALSGFYPMGTEPAWHSIAKIVIGLIAMGIAIADKKS
ncbi:MAG: hypothetical protein PHI45_00625 [Candidatus Pacebacteria bacterium]|jgi:uncharacterized membrane-anchored protein|nr:hypothetical protein [Candidatus Paceibacterota bacterium]MDD5013013.1 hypothetical protein [Candidatus Paceibacterota bacterium]MDD5752583.1 hypothetical protein [Candidatus Paceibacterota bacterium]